MKGGEPPEGREQKNREERDREHVCGVHEAWHPMLLRWVTSTTGGNFHCRLIFIIKSLNFHLKVSA